MKVTDLGSLEGPVLLFGGPYSNLQAVEALLRRAEKLGVPPEQMICTGDLVAYCADPAAVVEKVRALGIPVVAGNCECQLAADAIDCGCGFDDGSACDLLSRGWYAHADAQIGRADRDWMAALPDTIVFTHRDRRFAVIHGGATSVNRFIWSTDRVELFRKELACLTAETCPLDAVICGHSGIAFRRVVDGVEWLNAGVIGLPQNDGDPATRFAVLDNSVRIERLDYDAAGARDAMVAAGLVQGYQDSLVSGCWPSEDVLPTALRRAAVLSASG